MKKTNTDTIKLNDILQTYGLQNNINFHTHIAGHTLDLIITRNIDNIIILHTEPGPYISDHKFVKAILDLKKPEHETRQITYRNTKNVDMEIFRNDILNSLLLTTDMTNMNIDEIVTLYDDTLKEIGDKHAPLITKLIKIKPRSPWYSYELNVIKKEKRSLERKMLKTKNNEDIEKFKEKRNYYILKCKEHQTIYLKNEITKCNGDSGKIHSLINKWTYGNKSIPYENKDHKILADEFSVNFSNKTTEIVHNISKIIKQENIEPVVNYRSLYSTLPLTSSFQELTQDQVKKLITSSKSTTSLLDPIPISLLKSCLDIIITPITTLVNKSLTSGKFPDKWKTGVVTPLLKKPNLDLNFKNYRPVTNLSFTSKIIEKAALITYIKQFNKLPSFHDCNSAYRQNFSTETLLTKINTDIIENMDNKNLTMLVLLDLSAAFDTVNHNKLIDIMKYRFNISDKTLNWTRSYLSSRHNIIKVKNVTSDPHVSQHGVPQGSCIGPIFFLAYISYLYDVIGEHSVSIGGFADDHQLYLKFQPNNESVSYAVNCMEKCISKVRQFFLTHNLLINDNKTEFIIIGNKCHLAKINNISINVGNCNIIPSNKVKNLGIVFDEYMSMETQINEICKKSYFQLHRLRQLSKYLDLKLLETLIHSFVTSHLDYCNSLYFGLPDTLISKLQSIQNLSARLLSNTSKYAHITPILKQLHWLPVKQRILFKIAILTFKSLNGLSPLYISSFIEKYEPSRQLRSHNKNFIRKPKINSIRFGGRGFRYAASLIWNDLDDSLRHENSYGLFKKSLKTYLFARAYP